MEKLRFDFTVKTSGDGKSNIICITSIGTSNGQTYNIPAEYQPTSFHQVITSTLSYSKIKRTLIKRHQSRKIWITVTDDIRKVYLDEEENLQFNDLYLEEIVDDKNDTKPLPSASNQTLEELLTKLLSEKQTKSETQNLSKISKDFVIEKFTGKNSNAHQWIREFNKECERVLIVEDKEKIEILKYFLENAGLDWYRCMLIKISIKSEWNIWEKNFCDTFANKGWSPIRYALAFKYQTGSLLDYALKKEKLLLEVRKSIDIGTLIDLIASGLPNYLVDKIDRETLKETEDLYNELGKLEHHVGKNKYEKKQYTHPDTKTRKIEEKKPCQICLTERKGKRFHSEDNCWFKEKQHKTAVRSVNNSELEIELNEENPKN